MQEVITEGEEREEHTVHIQDQRTQSNVTENKKQDKVRSKSQGIQRDEIEIDKDKRSHQQIIAHIPGIDSMLPILTPLNTDINPVGVADGGMKGGKEISTHRQQGVTTGRGDLTEYRNLDEFDSDINQSLIPINPDTGQQTDRFNNKSGSRMSKKKEIILKRNNNSCVLL